MCEQEVLEADIKYVSSTIICCHPCGNFIENMRSMLSLTGRLPETEKTVSTEDKPPYREIDVFEERAGAFAKLLNIFHDDFECYVDRTGEEENKDIHSRMRASLNKARIDMDGFILECKYT